MKTLAFALLTVCLLNVPLFGADNSATSADVDRPPDLFYTLDTLLMARIDLGAITGPDLYQTLRGMFSNKTWAITDRQGTRRSRPGMCCLNVNSNRIRVLTPARTTSFAGSLRWSWHSVSGVPGHHSR